jgi:hypothetical protein
MILSKLVIIPCLLAIILISASCVATTSTITVTQTAPTVTVNVSPGINTTPIQTTTIPTGGIITITAADLLGEFDANAIAAESKYKDQILEVTGIILEIGRNDLGLAYLSFYGDIVSLITCYSFNSNWEDQLSDISEGQEVTVRGKLDEWDGLWLSLENCSVVQ